MNRDDIAMMWTERFHGKAFETVLDWAEELVRRHNEECAKIAEDPRVKHSRIAKVIREVKP